MIAEITAWPPRRILVGKGVDEADVDDIEIRFITEVAETLLIGTLTLNGVLVTLCLLSCCVLNKHAPSI